MKAEHVPRPVSLASIVVGVALAWMLLLPPAPLAQPLAFNHARHAALACVACHGGAETAAWAGIPAASVCVKCHAAAPAGVTGATWDALTRGQRPAWVRVTRVPDHTLFSHRRHVALARLECVSCHGDIGTRAAPPIANPVRLNMDDCLSCHKREGASEDCAACHR